MDKLKQWVVDHAARILVVPALIGSAQFLVNLFRAASDGVVTGEELHSLVSVASPVQIVLIGVVMIALKGNKG